MSYSTFTATAIPKNRSYNPLVNTLTAYREPDGIALDQTGQFFVTTDERDTRNAAGATGPRGGRTVSTFDTHTGALLGDTSSQLDDAADALGSYPDSRSNRGGSEPGVLDLTHYHGMTLVAVGLERANAVALIDVSNPAAPLAIDLASVGSAPEGIKFFRRGEGLFVAVAKEGSGTVSILEVSFANESSHAATMACTGQPWASTVTTRTTVSGEVRSRENAVPLVASATRLVTLRTHQAPVLVRMDANVTLAHLPSGRTRQMRAEYRRRVHDDSPLLVVLGSMPKRSMSGPPFSLQPHSTTV